jgi:peptidase A4-like protein
MRRRYLCGALVGVLAIAAAVSATGGGAASSVRHGRIHRISNSTSTNWSGYAVTGSRFTSVSASWTEPTAKCSGTAYSSFWVGLDGDTSNTVEQTGTDADCSGSTPQYYAWYEMYPKFPVNLRGTVRPGDKLNASVTTNGSGSFTLTITDTTQGWTNTTTARLKSAKLASAEVIAEAPSGSGGVLPLANFGTVGFTGSTVNGSVLTSSTPHLDPITMQSGSTVKAQPGSMSNGAFSVTWKHS